MNSVKIAAAQYPISYHKDFAAWRNHVSEWVKKAVAEKAQVMVFPEYGSMELVSLMPDEIQKDIKWQVREMNNLLSMFFEVFEDLARTLKITIVAPSFPVEINGAFLNRAYVFGKNGLAGYQDKIMMTRFENEEWGIASAPKVFTVFESDWGSFGVQICYDIEFGIGSQILANAGAEIILVPSCTETLRGATRVHVGARARALENQCYTVVSQTVGNADWSPAVDINYGFAAGYSTPDIGFPDLGILSKGIAQKEEWLIQDFDLNLIKEVRKSGSVFNFKDHKMIDTSYLGEVVEINQIKL